MRSVPHEFSFSGEIIYFQHAASFSASVARSESDGLLTPQRLADEMVFICWTRSTSEQMVAAKISAMCEDVPAEPFWQIIISTRNVIVVPELVLAENYFICLIAVYSDEFPLNPVFCFVYKLSAVY